MKDCITLKVLLPQQAKTVEQSMLQVVKTKKLH